VNPANDHSLQGRLYMDLSYHQGCNDRIAAIVMNRGLLNDLFLEGNYAVHMMQTFRDSFVYQIFGYNVVIMNEIPDGEWLVVCEDRPRIDFIKWTNDVLTYGQALQLQKKLLIDS